MMIPRVRAAGVSSRASRDSDGVAVVAGRAVYYVIGSVGYYSLLPHPFAMKERLVPFFDHRRAYIDPTVRISFPNRGGILYPFFINIVPFFWFILKFSLFLAFFAPFLVYFLCLFFTKGKESDRALKLFDEMQKGPPEAITAPNQFTYNALIGVLTFSGCLDVATEKFKEMKEVGEGEGAGGEK